MNNSTSTPFDGPGDIFSRYSFEALQETFAPAGIWSERLVMPIWYAIGFLGNPASAIIWYCGRMRRNNSSAVYLGSLAVSDLTFLVLHLLYTLHVTWGYDIYNFERGCEAFMFFFYLPQYLSVALVAAFTVERYVAVCHPFMKEKWCTVRKAFIIVVFFLLMSAALSSAQTYIWTFNPHFNICQFRMESEPYDPNFMNIWTWGVDMVMFALIPLVVLAVNVLVIREIVKLSRNRVISRQQSRSGGSSNTASTVTLLSVSFFLVITQLTATLVSNLQQAFPMGERFLSDEEARVDPTWTRLFTYLEARKIIETVCLSHYACYFFVYLFTGKHFRREVVYRLTCLGRFQCLQKVLSKSHKGERYSMVSSNGHTLASETYTTAFTTSM